MKKQTTFCQQIESNICRAYICFFKEIVRKREVERSSEREKISYQIDRQVSPTWVNQAEYKVKMNIKEIILIIGFGLLLCLVPIAQAGGDKSARTTVSIKKMQNIFYWDKSISCKLIIQTNLTYNSQYKSLLLFNRAGYYTSWRWGREAFRRLSGKYSTVTSLQHRYYLINW